MDLSLRCHCDSAAAPGDLNMIGVEKQASGGPTWLGPESGTKERSGGSTKRRYERADTCCGRCSASEADGTAEYESGHWGETLWFLSLSLSLNIASSFRVLPVGCNFTSLGDRVPVGRCWSPCSTMVRIWRVLPAHFPSWSVRLSRMRATVTKFCTSDLVSSTCSHVCDNCYSTEFYPALIRWLKKKSRAAQVSAQTIFISSIRATKHDVS